MQRDYIVAYHGTAAADVPSILKDGLVPSHGNGADRWANEHGKNVGRTSAERPPSVYVSKDVNFASEFAELVAEETKSAPVVLCLHVPKEAFTSQFKEDELSDPEPRKGHELEDFLRGTGNVVNYRTEYVIPADWIAAKLTPHHVGQHLAVY